MSALLSHSGSVAVFLLMLLCLPNSLPSPPAVCPKCETLLEKLTNMLETLVKSEVPEVNATSTSSDCDGQEETATGGKISFPGNGRYGDDKRCEWRIEAPELKIIEIRMERISGESGAGKSCATDQLAIIDVQDHNSTLLLTDFCRVNHPSPEALTSKGSEVLVRFLSKDGLGKGGFQLTYNYLSKPEQRTYESCSGVNVIVGSWGRIRYPVTGGPASNLHCRWRIVGPLRTQIQVKVLWFNKTKSPNDVKCDGGCCKEESLAIKDGDNEAAHQIAAFCEISAYFPSAVTSNNTAFVELMSNKACAFELTYRTLSKERRVMNPACEDQVIDVTGSGGVIHSPDYGSGCYPENARCRWRICAEEGQRVLFTFLDLDIEKEKICRSDSVELRDGYESTEVLLTSASSDSLTSSKIIGRYCGDTIPRPFTSTGPNVVIIFESDGTVEGNGFSLQWTTIPVGGLVKNKHAPVVLATTTTAVMALDKSRQSCNGRPTEMTSNEGVIYSPTSSTNQLNYPFNIECQWRVTVPTGMVILLTFERFALETPTGKECYDAVGIFDGPDESADSMGVYCGTDIPPDCTTTSNFLFVTFLSDGSLAGTGFLARYAAVSTRTTTTHIAVPVPRSLSCGVPDVMPLVYTRIVGGVEAIAHSWPWQVSLRYKPRHGEHWCGGAIVSSCWIITAAHCCYYYGNATNFRVSIGGHDQSKLEGTEETINVVKIVIHPDYKPDTNDHDLALLQLSTDISFGRTAKPVCVCDDPIPDGTLCVVTGWGDTRANGSSGKSNTLNQLNVPTISKDVCNQKGWYNGDLTETMLCAGFPDGMKDSCQGDSGGPLVRLVDGHWCLIGITSWGFDCAQPNHPGIYTKMSDFSEWVRLLTGATET